MSERQRLRSRIYFQYRDCYVHPYHHGYYDPLRPLRQRERPILEDEKKYLKEQIDMLREELNDAEEQLKELEVAR